MQDRTVVNKQNVIKLNKITEQRIKHSRKTNKNLAALDAAIVNKAKSLNNKTTDVADTAQQTKVKNVDGYVVEYSTKANMKSAKKKNVKASTTSLTVKNLKKGKKYYVTCKRLQSHRRTESLHTVQCKEGSKD